jgi:2-oxoglutarate ferredoxin oxidoreductase subunit alpha
MTGQAGKADSFSIALFGKGGAGVITAGEMLLAAAARAGLYGMMIRAVGPQIRGGESAALIRLGQAPVNCLDDRFDVLLAIGWKHAERLLADIALDAHSIVVTDPGQSEVPDAITASGAEVRELPMGDLVDSLEGGRANMVALGYLAAIAGIPQEAINQAIEKKLGRMGRQAVDVNFEAAKLGFLEADGSTVALTNAAEGSADNRWMLSGNHATGLGAMRGGIRFAAAYPITPATEILEWLAPRLNDAGGTLSQAEDELASINMVIGASYGGIPSLTATSGPGLSLMIESIGLAICAEIPLVIVNVMRAGPSTGIPTSSEQSDFNSAVYGVHGDAPHIVVAPSSVTDCVYTTQWAVHLAEATQAPVIVLSDQFIGQANVIAEPVPEITFFAKRKVAENITDEFERYAITADGISPMPLPGMAGGQYTADGLEHSPKAVPSGIASNHNEQLDKRARKIAAFDYGQHWADIEGDGDLAILSWGSTTSVVKEAIGRLPKKLGNRVKLIAPRLLLPVRPDDMAAALAGVSRVMVIEQNHSGQFYRFLRAFYELPADVSPMHRPGPSVFRPGEIATAIQEWSKE